MIKNPIDRPKLRRKLVALAKRREMITYKDILGVLGFEFELYLVRSLTGRLDEITESETKAGRPSLAPLVVRQDTKIPGTQFFSKAGYQSADTMTLAELRDLHAIELEKIWRAWG